MKQKTAFLALVLAALTFPALRSDGQINGPLAPHKPKPAPGSIQIDVDMVLVNVSVTDPYGHPVANLEKKDFRLFEDNQEQEIMTFSREDVHISIGEIFDNRGSRSEKMDTSSQAAEQFLYTYGSNDVFFHFSYRDH